MYASSRNSLAQLTSELESRRSSVGFELVADELYLACDLLGREKSLRQALSDSGRSAQNRGEIVQTIFRFKAECANGRDPRQCCSLPLVVNR